MKLSKKRRDALYAAIAATVLKVRVNLAINLDAKTFHKIDDSVFAVTDDAWKNVKTALDFKDET